MTNNKVRLSFQASRDLTDIADYYLDYSLKTSENVLADIRAVFRLLERYPTCGTQVADKTRRNISNKYRYVVASTLEDGEVVILAIYRRQNRTFE